MLRCWRSAIYRISRPSWRWSINYSCLYEIPYSFSVLAGRWGTKIPKCLFYYTQFAVLYQPSFYFWWIQPSMISTSLCLVDMRCARSTSWYQFPGAFAPLVQYTTLRMTHCSEHMSQLCKRLGTLRERFNTLASKVFIAMMRLLPHHWCSFHYCSYHVY